MTATVAHLLDDRGELHIGDRVCEYIPEYAAHGKDAITLEHVLTRTGRASPTCRRRRSTSTTSRTRNTSSSCSATRVRVPVRASCWPTTRSLGASSSARSSQRVTGKSIRQVMQEEILDPLGFRWGNYGVARGRRRRRRAAAMPPAPPPLPPLSTVLERALGLHPDEVTRTSNDPRFLTGVIPAGNVVTTRTSCRASSSCCARRRARRSPRAGCAGRSVARRSSGPTASST